MGLPELDQLFPDGPIDGSGEIRRIPHRHGLAGQIQRTISLERRGRCRGGTPDGKIAYRYNKKAVVVYYDGHVGEVGMDDMKRIDQTGGIRNVFWDADAN
jgi:prepilin-type processing-associated H-X9-DG protein